MAPDDILPHNSRWGISPGEQSIYGKYENTFLKAKYIKPRNISWLIKDLFPLGEITLIAGDPSVGKTTVAVSIAALASNPNLVHPVGEKGSISADIHGNVLWVAFEDSLETTLVPRALAAGADQENLALWIPRSSSLNYPLQITSQKFELFQKIRAFPGIVLVVFDNVDLIYKDYPETRSGRKLALLDITNLARSMGFAILANAHYTKSATRTTNLLDRISGGSLLGQTVRKVMFVEEMPRDDSGSGSREFALFDTKSSNSGVTNGLRYIIESTTIPDGEDTIQTSRIKWLGRVERPQIIELESRSRKSYEPRAKIGLEDAVAFVRNFLAEGPRMVSTLEEATVKAGISSKMLGAARKELGIISKKQRQAGQYSGWLCCLPEDDSASSNSEAQPDQPSQVNQVCGSNLTISAPDGAENPLKSGQETGIVD